MSKPRLHTLDVRPLLARGQEPFSEILKTFDALKPAESLALLTPFLPSPLIEHLKSRGYTAIPERLADGSWQTRFDPS